ncbi:Uncharacterised protein [Cedecea neteri]|uniref:Uncharacterized protein n=1 Tax=Cedecea neteri TaxID=158822 RepID=A0A2X2V9V3_9ENTR|nr:Uncharacterised protein [Cedecea neteri]
MMILITSKADGRNQRTANKCLAARTMARQPPEDPEEQQVVSKN